MKLICNAVLISRTFANKIALITKIGTSVGDKNSATGRLKINYVAGCLRHNHNYAREACVKFHLCLNVDNG